MRCLPRRSTEPAIPAGHCVLVRDQGTAIGQPPLHRHEYFQIYVNLAGAPSIGWVRRCGIRPGTLSFIMPLRVHCIRHVEHAEFFVINFRRDFLRPESRIDLLELEDVPIETMPELALFCSRSTWISSSGPRIWRKCGSFYRRMQAEHRDGAFSRPSSSTPIYSA